MASSSYNVMNSLSISCTFLVVCLILIIFLRIACRVCTMTVRVAMHSPVESVSTYVNTHVTSKTSATFFRGRLQRMQIPTGPVIILFYHASTTCVQPRTVRTSRAVFSGKQSPGYHTIHDIEISLHAYGSAQVPDTLHCSSTAKAKLS